MDFQVSHFTGKAFVSFEYQHYQKFFLEEGADNTVDIGGTELVFEDANNPSDVLWENMNTS